MKGTQQQGLRSLFVVVLSLGLGHAWAEDSTPDLEKIDVISMTPLSGVGQSINEIPSNVQTLRAKDIEQQGTLSIADLLNNNLGSVTVSNGTGSAYQNDVLYRGFSATSTLGAPVGLSVFFDGVRMNESFGDIVNWDLIPMNAISSINLLPGSNPLFGLNTLGGSLVIITKNGRDDQGTDISLTGGSFGRRALSVETGWADDEHSTDYYVSMNWDKQRGYRNYSDSEIKQLYGKVRWDGESTDAELTYAYATTALHATQALPPEMLSNPSSAYTSPDGVSNKMSLIKLKIDHELSKSDTIQEQIYFKQNNSNSLNSNVRFDDGCNAGSDTFSCGSTDSIFSSPGTARNVYNSAFPRYTSDINSSLVKSSSSQSQIGLRIQWDNVSKLLGNDNHFIAGVSADFSHLGYGQNTYLAQLVNYQAIAVSDCRYNTNSSGTGSCGSGLIDSVNVSGTSKEYSFYLSDAFKANQKLNVIPSLSYNITIENQNGTNDQFLNGDGGFKWTAGNGVNYYNPNFVGLYTYKSSSPGYSTVTAPSGYTKGPYETGLSGSHQYYSINPALGFNYELGKNQDVFGGYSQSLRAPTILELSCANPAQPCATPTGFNGDPDLKPVIARTFELGFRGKTSNGFSWNIAAYDTRLQDDIQYQIASSSSSLGYFSNVGDTERRGIDLGMSQKWDRLFLALNYGFVNAEYKSSFIDTNGDTVTSGNKIPGIANQSIKVRAAYQVTPSLLFGSNLIAVSGQYAQGDQANKDSKTPGYSVLNLDLHYKLSDGWSTSLLINNVLDRQYYTYGTEGYNIYAQTGVQEKFVTPAAPRTYWLTLTYSFGGNPEKDKSKKSVDKD